MFLIDIINLVCYFLKEKIKILIYVEKSYWFMVGLRNIVKFIKEIKFHKVQVTIFFKLIFQYW